MRVGVGLPAAVPGTPPAVVLEWARRADDGPFSSLAVLDRLVYDSYEPMLTLAAAASATQRLRLATTILVAPLHPTAVLAKAAATLDALSGGRFVLGVAVGARAEDYHAAERDTKGRGARLTSQLQEIRDVWESDRIGPSPPRIGGPPILLGGTNSDKAFLRMARSADGFIHGGGPPKTFARAVDKAYAAWEDGHRPGRPQIWGQGYFALTDADTGTDHVRDYYSFIGPFAERIAAGVLTTPQAVVQYVKAYEDSGCDELILLPAVSDPGELDALADVVGDL